MDTTVCNYCQGTGETEIMRPHDDGSFYIDLMRCFRCGGRGQIAHCPPESVIPPPAETL